jgi:hypothetical protein
VTTTSVPYSLLRDVAACLDGTADEVQWQRASEGVERLLLAECEHEWRAHMDDDVWRCDRCAVTQPLGWVLSL